MLRFPLLCVIIVEVMAQDFLTDAFVRLRQKLKGVSGGILPDPGGAEDVLQDSFVQLWRRKYPLGSEKEAEALLARTVRNASLNERRRQRTVPLEREGIRREDHGRHCQGIENGAGGGEDAALPSQENT